MARMITSRKDLMDLALFYCSKRETSRLKLQQYLKRKLPRGIDNTALLEAIELVLNDLERLKVIDHERYAGMLTREYARRGKGKRYLEQKFRERGMTDEFKKLEISSDDEFERAVELAEKTLTKNAVRKLTEPFKIKQKLMQKLVTSGYDLTTAKNAIDAALKKA